jgi:hypothetical protein
MRKIGTAIVGILILLSCLASAPGASASSGTSPADQDHSLPNAQVTQPAGSQKPLTDIHDIKTIVPVPVPLSLAFIALWVAVCVVAGALFLGGWHLWKRRRGQPVVTVEALLSPEDTALQRLAAMSEDPAMDGKAFYFTISSIFRDYLQGQFGIDGPEMTTEELLPHIEALALERDDKQDIRKFLVSSDPVKFAGLPANRIAMENDLAFVKSFVEKTAASLADETGLAPPGTPE